MYTSVDMVLSVLVSSYSLYTLFTAFTIEESTLAKADPKCAKTGTCPNGVFTFNGTSYEWENGKLFQLDVSDDPNSGLLVEDTLLTVGFRCLIEGITEVAVVILTIKKGINKGSPLWLVPWLTFLLKDMLLFFEEFITACVTGFVISNAAVIFVLDVFVFFVSIVSFIIGLSYLFELRRQRPDMVGYNTQENV